MASIHELVASARLRLRQAGIPDAEADLDARLLAERLLGWDAARYFAHADADPPVAFPETFGRAIDRRVRREPVAYITGRQEFWDLTFEVTPAVLIPRPETEIVVEICLEQRPDPGVPLRVADVCTGSGCLAVAIAHERPRARVTATDISPEALAIARRNAERHGVADRVECMLTDVLQGVVGPFDAIVANPPYVPAGEAAALQPEVAAFEPRVALFGGPDGLDIVRAVVAQAVTRLAPDGVLICEFGFGQADAVAGLVEAARGLVLVELRRDLQGIPRTLLARRRG